MAGQSELNETSTIRDFHGVIQAIFALHEEMTGKTKMNSSLLCEYARQLGCNDLEIACLSETWGHIYHPEHF